jgi:enoyl-CoA hydratase
VAASKRILVESADWPIAETFERQRAISEPVRAAQDARRVPSPS